MLKKNWYLFTPLAIVGLPAFLLAFYILAYGYPVNEAVEAVSHFIQSSTRYSMKYSADHFSRIRPGMDGKQVFDYLGVPFERRNNDTEWLYSLPQGSAKAYHERKILFVRDAKRGPLVKEVVKSFHAPK
jgi:hypothetical protein